jgi:GNAT superfamily N-acetyltransferase
MDQGCPATALERPTFTVEIRDILPEQIDEVVRLHVEAFAGFFMTALGRSFLEAYYTTVLSFPGRIFLGAADRDGSLVGFAAGFVDPQAFYRTLRRRRLRLATAALPAVLRRPILFVRLRASQRRLAGAADSDALQGRCRAELASLGVTATAAGRGVGRQLLTAFCAQARAAGALELRLTTDADGNEAVNRFYRSNGLRVAQMVASSPGRMMVEYCMDLKAGAA